MAKHNIKVKNLKNEIVTMTIEARTLSEAQSKCRKAGLIVLDIGDDKKVNTKKIKRILQDQSNNHLTLVVISCIVIGSIFSYSKFSKWEAKQRIIEIARKPIINSLKDPLSAQFTEERIASDKITVCGKVNAKNALGGYVGFKYYISNGEEFLIEGSSFSTWPISKLKGDISEEIKFGYETMERSDDPDVELYIIKSANSIRGPLFGLLYLKLCYPST